MEYSDRNFVIDHTNRERAFSDWRIYINYKLTIMHKRIIISPNTHSHIILTTYALLN